MSEDRAMASMLSLLRGWELQAVWDLPFRFWLSETGEAIMSLGQNFDIIEATLSLSRGENCDRSYSIRSRGRNVMEEELSEIENVQAEGRKKDSLSENSEENFELREVGSELVRTVCINQNEATRTSRTW